MNIAFVCIILSFIYIAIDYIKNGRRDIFLLVFQQPDFWILWYLRIKPYLLPEDTYTYPYIIDTAEASHIHGDNVRWIQMDQINNVPVLPPIGTNPSYAVEATSDQINRVNQTGLMLIMGSDEFISAQGRLIQLRNALNRESQTENNVHIINYRTNNYVYNNTSLNEYNQSIELLNYIIIPDEDVRAISHNFIQDLKDWLNSIFLYEVDNTGRLVRVPRANIIGGIRRRSRRRRGYKIII